MWLTCVCRNNYGFAQRRINQLLDQEGGCSLEELLTEDDLCLNQCKASHQRLNEFMCQRDALQKLIAYATRMPADPEDHSVAHKFPFVAADVLTASKQIASALIDGGLASEEANTSTEEKPAPVSGDDDDSVQQMVRNSLNETNVSVRSV